MAKGFDKWFETFLDEKKVPYCDWEIESSDGMTHYLDNEVVIEAIKEAPAHEKKGIKNMLVKIDFMNGNVNDYFKHLAKGLVESY